ncbi:PilW family protein [Longivirga aurantiaca]|uniref:PilW family protein n=1 Tax=Longivirga aurantiaca TaxID=1837743 RepID=A0ABW1T3C3_9ACTN
MSANRSLKAVRDRLAGRPAEEGVTLVELLVTMVLLSIVLAIAAAAFQATAKVYTATDDDATGLADARKVAERMGRDIRNARGVDAGATTSQLVVWIDANSDYKRQTNESITWKLEPSGDGLHYDVIRKVGSATQVIEARSLVSQIAFTYDLTPPNTQVVQTLVTYDSIVGRGASARTLYFAERLRNVDEQY